MKIKDTELAKYYNTTTQTLRNWKSSIKVDKEDKQGQAAKYVSYSSKYHLYQAAKCYYYLHKCEEEDFCVSNFEILQRSLPILQDYLQKSYIEDVVDKKLLESINLTQKEWNDLQKETALRNFNKIKEIIGNLS